MLTSAHHRPGNRRTTATILPFVSERARQPRRGHRSPCGGRPRTGPTVVFLPAELRNVAAARVRTYALAVSSLSVAAAGTAANGWWTTPATAAAFAPLAVALLDRRRRVELNDLGMTLQGFLFNRDIPWEEVRTITVNRGFGPGPGSARVCVVVAGGRRRRAGALSAGMVAGPNGRREAHELVHMAQRHRPPG